MPILRPILRPLTSPLTRALTEGVGGFNPASLFAAGELGAWYDPSDFATLFQDMVGTTPVTATGQPVGLMLDKQFGLVRGAEQIGPYDFTTWSTVGTVAGRTANSFTNSSGAGAGVSKALLPDTTKTYEITVEFTKSDSTTLFGIYGQSIGEVIATTTAASGTLTARSKPGTGGFIYFRLASNGTVTITSFSAREIPGNHATQATSTARPLVKQTGTAFRVNYDGVDDALNTTFPDLGTNVTIARSVPGVGASILTGQTIGAGVRADSTSHCGLLIINRALTAAETANVTAYLNRKAGV